MRLFAFNPSNFTDVLFVVMGAFSPPNTSLSLSPRLIDIIPSNSQPCQLGNPGGLDYPDCRVGVFQHSLADCCCSNASMCRPACSGTSGRRVMPAIRDGQCAGTANGHALPRKRHNSNFDAAFIADGVSDTMLTSACACLDVKLCEVTSYRLRGYCTVDTGTAHGCGSAVRPCGRARLRHGWTAHGAAFWRKIDPTRRGQQTCMAFCIHVLCWGIESHGDADTRNRPADCVMPHSSG